MDSYAEDEQVQSEIKQLRRKKMREQKRKKKKEREIAAKRRRRAAFGMDLNAIDVPDNDKIFSLATITNAGDLEAAREVDLEKVTEDQLAGGDDDSDDEVGLKMHGEGGDSIDDEDKDETNYTWEKFKTPDDKDFEVTFDGPTGKGHLGKCVGCLPFFEKLGLTKSDLDGLCTYVDAFEKFFRRQEGNDGSTERDRISTLVNRLTEFVYKLNAAIKTPEHYYAAVVDGSELWVSQKNYSQSDFLPKLGDALVRIVAGIPHGGVLVFLPSYALLRKCERLWNPNGFRQNNRGWWARNDDSGGGNSVWDRLTDLKQSYR